MKLNMPVTQKNQPLRPGVTIVSHTDHKGRITYVNDDFVDASGFSREELIGQSHNIVRHPDIPPEVFRDLWDTLKAERAWKGIVKNRCKNGDHYWVRATVTPKPDGGYTSVRIPATPGEIHAMEKLIETMKADSSIRLEEGHVRPPFMQRLWRRFGNMRLTTKMRLMSWVAVTAVLFTAMIGYAAIQRGNHTLFEVYSTNTAPIAKIAALQKIVQNNYAEVLRAFQHAPPKPSPGGNA